MSISLWPFYFKRIMNYFCCKSKKSIFNIKFANTHVIHAKYIMLQNTKNAFIVMYEYVMLGCYRIL